MTSFIKISNEEKVYGQKNLLQAEMELLTATKKMLVFKELRKQELLLKIEIRKKLDEIRESIEILEKSFPKVDEDKVEQEIVEIYSPEKKRAKTIEDELNEIRLKLQRLQR